MSYTRNEWWKEQASNLYSCWMDRESKSLYKSWRKWVRNPPTRAKNSKNTELNGSGGERKKGDKGLGLFCPGWSHQPGPKATYLSRLVAPTRNNGLRGLWSWLDPPTGTKNRTFHPGPGWSHQSGLSRLVAPAGTKGPWSPTLSG